MSRSVLQGGTESTVQSQTDPVGARNCGEVGFEIMNASYYYLFVLSVQTFWVQMGKLIDYSRKKVTFLNLKILLVLLCFDLIFFLAIA